MDEDLTDSSKKELKELLAINKDEVKEMVARLNKPDHPKILPSSKNRLEKHRRKRLRGKV